MGARNATGSQFAIVAKYACGSLFCNDYSVCFFSRELIDLTECKGSYLLSSECTAVCDSVFVVAFIYLLLLYC